jgi:hypothetical protein
LKIKPIVVGTIGLVSTSVSVAEEGVLPSGVSISGIVQVEARFNQDYDGNDSSDFVADEVGVAIEAQVHKMAKAQISFLYEEGATDLEIDEAFVTLGQSEAYLAVGQLYVPFGNFESHLISDPLTLELGEAREKAAQVGFEKGGVYGSIYAFNGATQEGSEDKIDHYGANIGFAQETERFSYDLGVGYISDIGDSDGLSDTLGENVTSPDYGYVDGLGAHILFNIGPVSLIGEYVTALDGFNVDHFAFNGKGAEPKAWNAEMGYTFEIGGKETTLALGYQGTEEMVAMELPETRVLAGLSVGIYENTTFAFEYARDEDYDENDGGTGKDADMMTLQLAVEF